MERGRPDQVRKEVRTGLEIMGKQPGFIFSPVDNIRELSPAIENNNRMQIITWQSILF